MGPTFILPLDDGAIPVRLASDPVRTIRGYDPLTQTVTREEIVAPDVIVNEESLHAEDDLPL